jgi:CheY-like chemotaxis protein
MNLHFGICWIEDQASDADVEAVEEAVRSSGFEPNIERVEREEDIKEFAARQHHHQDYDLILLDLRLGGGIRGDDLAPAVRNAFRSTPILFYSAEAEGRLRQMMADKLVDGVYCVHRDRLTGRVAELVANLSPALNRLSTMRGLASRVVAECDQELRAILSHLGTQGHEVEIVASLKARARSSAEAQLQDLDPIQELSSLLSSHAVTSGALYFEARDRVRAVGGDAARDLLRSMREYPNRVIERRNTLAHALEVRTDAGWKIFRAATKPLTVDDFQRYRKDFLAQLRDVRQLRKLLVGE